MYGPEYVKHRESDNLYKLLTSIDEIEIWNGLHIFFKVEDDGNLVPANMSDDCVVQTWYRFLRKSSIFSPV